jgi:hypothetical protein
MLMQPAACPDKERSSTVANASCCYIAPTHQVHSTRINNYAVRS